MLIVGINAYHGDASAAAIVDGRLVAAAEEERFNRVKHCAGFPHEALRYVLKAAGAEPRDLKMLAVARDPWARLWPKAWYALKMPSLAKSRLTVRSRFATIAGAAAEALGIDAAQIEVRRVEHHNAHLASAFLVSPFDAAAVFSVDGLGDFASAMWGVGRGNRLYPAGAVTFPHSLGIYYTALTQYLGFLNYGDEYKVMGLASYGEPEFIDEFRGIVIAPNGGRMNFELNPAYFLHHRGSSRMTWEGGEPHIDRLYSDYLAERLGAARQPGAAVDDRHRAIASSMQRRLEEVILDRLRTLRRVTGLKQLCLAGGVAYNCVVNGKIREHTGFEDVYIQAAAGDAGLAIGAAMHVWHQEMGNPREFVMEHAYWGPEFSGAEIESVLSSAATELERQGCTVRQLDDEGELCRLSAAHIACGEVVGWFQGRMEWGPRALGNRSILADPRRPEMRDILNAKIKRREMFRPFAPSIAEETTGDYFEQSYPSPFMLMAYAVRPDKRGVIPAATHIDGSGRLQTVNHGQNPLYHRLIQEFGRQTGVPVLLNTSFNENEPVACKPREALDCFLRTRMDVLVMGHYFVSRSAHE
ncbi:MAG: carbamoyltransferase family protein [Candidatus Binataceae bacterium]